MSEKVYNALFLCTGNSARSIMAECAMNHWGRGRFRAYSAGSQPTGQINPYALRLLQNLDFNTEGLRSKSWEEFTAPDAPELDFVFTVCDSAAAEVCPVWPGQPMSAHWGVEDPAAFVGSEEKTMQMFRKVYGYLDNRIKIFVALPIASLDRMALQKRLDQIGHELPAATGR
jgi:arsenate reductase